MQSKSRAERMGKSPDNHFGLCAGRPYLGHHSTSLLGCQIVHARNSPCSIAFVKPDINDFPVGLLKL